MNLASRNLTPPPHIQIRPMNETLLAIFTSPPGIQAGEMGDEISHGQCCGVGFRSGA